MDNKVLIIVVNYNREADTIACIESLLVQSHQAFHIGLIDNNSDNIALLTARYESHSRVSLIKSDTNLGFAKANNKVLSSLDPELNKFRYIALINNDAVADKDWLRQMIQCSESNSADQISSCIINYYQRDQLDNIGHQFINTGEIVPIGFQQPVSSFDQVRETFGSCAAGSLYSVEMIRQIGFFDAFFETGYEDAELGARAVICGYTCLYNPNAIVYHKISQSVSGVDDRAYRLRQQINIYYSYFKLIPSSVIMLNMPFIILKYLLVMLVEAITFRWSYIKMHVDTVKGVLRLRHQISEARKTFHNEQNIISMFSILRKQVFFLFFDIKRLIAFIFRGRKTVFDKSLQS